MSCCALLMGLSGAAIAQEKITYQDQLLPLIENHCVRCHNPDKRKGDLDLSTYNGAIKGGASGSVLSAGNPDASKLFKAVTHAEEPTMPPNKPKLPDKELEVIRRWIAGGLLENSGSKAVAPRKPSVDLTLQASDYGKPKGPPPMPAELLREPVLVTRHPPVVTGLAHSPWAPLLALTGQKQVLLYQTDTAELLGVLPFPGGQPVKVTFSRSGKLLLASGGHAAKSGQVVVWDVVSGGQVAEIGREYDSVLTADMTVDQTRIALGGPDRLVKIYSAPEGELLHKIKKHTDWVTVVAFSPNGQMLASGDRAGGLNIWDADSGQLLFATPGQKASVTALSWRDDSKILSSASEDGTIKWWEAQDGRQVKTWNAHEGGVLSVNFSHDGKSVSGGRDKRVSLWDANGSKIRSVEFNGQMIIQTAFNHDGTRVVATDFGGATGIWNVEGKEMARCDANPQTLAVRIHEVQQRIKDLEKAGTVTSSKTPDKELLAAQASLAEAEKKFAQAKKHQVETEDEVKRLKEVAAAKEPPPDIAAQLAAARAVRAKAREAAAQAGDALPALVKRVKAFEDSASAAAEKAAADWRDARQELAKLRAASLFTPVYQAREQVAARKRELAQLRAASSTPEEAVKTEEAIKKTSADLAAEEAKLNQATSNYERVRPQTGTE